VTAHTDTFGNRHIARRLWWACDLARRGDAVELIPRRGCRRVVHRRVDCELLLDYRSPRAWLEAAPGQRFVCCGPAIADTVAVEVIAVDDVGALTVRVFGELGRACDHVQITRLAEDFEQAASLGTGGAL
jgi:hypothetical protein